MTLAADWQLTIKDRFVPPLKFGLVNGESIDIRGSAQHFWKLGQPVDDVKTRCCMLQPAITQHRSIAAAWSQKWKPESTLAICPLVEGHSLASGSVAHAPLMEKIVHVKLSAAVVGPNIRTATRCTRCRPFAPPLTMSTSASSKSTRTRKNLASGLTRLSNESIPVLRLAKESVAGIGIPGPETALGGVLAVAEMIRDMQSNQNDLAKLKSHLEKLIKIDVSGCDGELKKCLTELALKLEPFVDECESLAAKSGIKQRRKGKKYKERIQSFRDDIASNIQEFTFCGSISIEKLVKDLVNTVEHKKTVDEAKAQFKEVKGTVNETATTYWPGSDFQIVNHIYGGKGGSEGGGGVQGGAGGVGEGPTVQLAYTAGNLTVNNVPAGPAVVNVAQKAECMYLYDICLWSIG
ncbi:hypothetical protein B0H11DRAFT_1898440 [Mycena galericulata]|nr:hypothetical protein B0H11DRAFT_1898440 [Mycena galericulata]